MKVACQTILWGTQFDDPLTVFQTIYELGFEGIEIAQPPSVLPEPSELRAIFEAFGLEFVGFYGGSLANRIDYCQDFRPKYLAIEDWDDVGCKRALREGFTLALHPHAYKRNHCIETASILLRDHLELKFLPDTAHLFLARDNPAKAIESYAPRLAAIHFKDWTPKYGRSFHRYARGFVELGNGIINLENILQSLRKIEFNGWLVVEQDSSAYSPRTSTETSTQWLCDHGIPVTKREPKQAIPKPKSRPKIAPSHSRKMAFLMDILMTSSNREDRLFWNSVLEAFCELVPSKMATLWEFSPTKNLLGLLAFWSPMIEPCEPYVMHCSEVLTGVAVESQVVSHLDTRQSYNGRHFANPQLIEEFKLHQMISIPVLNTYNSNHVELVINLYPKKEFKANLSDNELARCANYVAIAYEALLEDACQSIASTVNLAVVGTRQSGKFLDEIVRDTQDMLRCESVTIFLVDETGKKLEAKATTGLEWNPIVSLAERYYVLGEGLTGRVWKNCKPLLTTDPANEPGYLGKSWENTELPVESCLIAPLVDPQGLVIGVIRCANKHPQRTPERVGIFSESDLSIIDAAAQAAGPHLLVLLAEERRARTLGRLTHELKVPLTVIRGAAEFIYRESKSKNFEFSYPYAENIFSWHDLACRLLNNVDFFRYSIEGLRLRIECVYLFADIFAPARSQVGPLMRERSFSTWNIRDDRFKAIPRVWIDRQQFQQVFFNLISNSIKYAYNDPTAFQVEVATQAISTGYEILFRDWGPGIPEGYEEIIFQENIRGPNAEQANVSGDGLGLWVVSEIIQAHGGTIEVSNRVQPTEFRIWLPKKIAKFWTT
jgi:signal transduction histidine kinase/sugar phosphate isomerase/epimerase